MNKQKIIAVLLISLVLVIGIQGIRLNNEVTDLRDELDYSFSMFFKRNAAPPGYELEKSYQIKPFSYTLYSFYCESVTGSTNKDHLSFLFTNGRYMLFTLSGVDSGGASVKEIKEEGVYVKGKRALYLTSQNGKISHSLPFQIEVKERTDVYQLDYYGRLLHPRRCGFQMSSILEFLEIEGSLNPIKEEDLIRPPLRTEEIFENIMNRY